MQKVPNFKVSSYSLLVTTDTSSSLTISGLKLAPPSKRITFNQKGVKVINAQITYHHKKGDQVIEVKRINHIKSFEEVRIHTDQTLYPGNYTIVLKFESKNLKQLDNLDRPNAWQSMSWRNVFPCIDNPEARQNSKVELTKEI